MSDLNLVVLSGRIGGISDPRDVGDSRVLNVRLAVKGWDSRAKEEVTDWYNVTCWNYQADYVSNYQKVGNKVVIHGRIKQRDKDVHYGETLSKPYKAFEVVASQVHGMGGRETEEEVPF